MTFRGFVLKRQTIEDGACSRVHGHGYRLQAMQTVSEISLSCYLPILSNICIQFYQYVLFPSCKYLLGMSFELRRVQYFIVESRDLFYKITHCSALCKVSWKASDDNFVPRTLLSPRRVGE